MSLIGVTTKASELTGLRTIPRAANWADAYFSDLFGSYALAGTDVLPSQSIQWLEQNSSAFPLMGSTVAFYYGPNGPCIAMSTADPAVALVYEEKVHGVWRLVSAVPLRRVTAGRWYLTKQYLCGGENTPETPALYSTTDGIAWSLETDAGGVMDYLNSLVVFGGKIYVSGDSATVAGDIWSNASGSWAQVYTTGPSGHGFTRMAVDSTNVYAADSAWGRVHHSADGASWSYDTLTTGVGYITGLLYKSGYMYASHSANGVYKQTSPGTWSLISAYPVRLLAATSSYLYGIAAAGLVRSSDGVAWASIKSSIPSLQSPLYTGTGTELYLVTTDKGITYAFGDI